MKRKEPKDEHKGALDFPEMELPFFRGGFGRVSKLLNEPLTDVFEEKDEVVVTAELPGISKEDLSLKITDDGISIKVEKREHKEERKQEKEFSSYSYSSRFEGYSRFVQFPTLCKSETAKATYNNGVLEVRVKKRASEKGREIKIS